MSKGSAYLESHALLDSVQLICATIISDSLFSILLTVEARGISTLR